MKYTQYAIRNTQYAIRNAFSTIHWTLAIGNNTQYQYAIPRNTQFGIWCLVLCAVLCFGFVSMRNGPKGGPSGI
jgi:hypothetical protein